MVANGSGKLTAASSVFFPDRACNTRVWICGPSFELAVGAGWVRRIVNPSKLLCLLVCIASVCNGTNQFLHI
jgi:hypothetical protein